MYSRTTLLLVFLLHLGGVGQSQQTGNEGRPERIPSFEDTPMTLGDPKITTTVYTLDGKAVTLRQLRKDAPTLYVTTSLTCPVSRDHCAAVDRIYEEFRDRAHVVLLYTIEAHPIRSKSPYSDEEWLTPRNVQEEIFVEEPKTLDERIARAKAYKKRMGIQAPLYVDNMDNEAWKRLGGGPNCGIFTSGIRQGWLDPYIMRLEMKEHFQAEEDRKRAALMKEQDIHPWNWDDLMLGDSFDEIRLLLDKHPDWIHHRISHDRGNYQRKTLLHLAVENDKPQHLTYFLRSGVEVDAVDFEGESALHLAAEKYPSHMEALLDAGASINLYSREGFSPLHLAILNRQHEVAKQLLEKGAYLDMQAAAGMGNNPELARFLALYKTQPIRMMKLGKNLLVFAVQSGDPETVRMVIEAGVPVDTFVKGARALAYAIENGDTEIVQLLIQGKTDLSGKVRYLSWSPEVVQYAIAEKQHDILDLLLSSGADVNQLNDDQQTPLHKAAYFGDVDSIRILLKHGAEKHTLSGSPGLEPCGPLGQDLSPVLENAVHLAAGQHQPEALKLLMEEGVKINLRNRDGLTPLDLATRPTLQVNRPDLEKRREACIQILKEAGAVVGKPVKRENRKMWLVLPPSTPGEGETSPTPAETPSRIKLEKGPSAD